MDNLISTQNIDVLLARYLLVIEAIGPVDQKLSGQMLLSYLKREKVSCGPYPDVTLFEAANRIMSDLVILHGVRWILNNDAFPFSEYLVEFGHANNNGFDIKAKSDALSLIGEAFNVAPSFYQGKKTTMLKKLRGTSADFKLIMVNSDAVAMNYCPQPHLGEYFVFVNIEDGSARMAPNTHC